MSCCSPSVQKALLCHPFWETQIICIIIVAILPCRDQAGITRVPSGSRRGQSSSSGTQDASVQLGGIVGCMACLLQRLAYGQSLSAESRGGGKQSNARLLPYLFQLGHYFAGFCSESDLRVSSLLLLVFTCGDKMIRIPTLRLSASCCERNSV